MSLLTWSNLSSKANGAASLKRQMDVRRPKDQVSDTREFLLTGAALGQARDYSVESHA